ncbi:hypothetical protein [Bradyrhizobium sp. NAS80.1]|uniref:hypothetical protein n=1 Tax=Bradyrhizobium sp. NAS80.1 TaxID=1680159 RepID=UPI00269D0079
MMDLRLFEDVLKGPARPLPVVVQETEPLAVDRDELFLVEDWRLDPGGAALPPGATGSEIAPIFTINGKIAPRLHPPSERAAEAPLDQRLPTRCCCSQIRGC